MSKAKVISICNPKGGVGKTTSTANIGAALNQLGKKVKLIDLNPNANLSQSLGITNTENNICQVLRGNSEIYPFEILKDFYVVPSTIDLTEVEIELGSQPEREFYLKNIIDKVKDSYDYILIDCPSSLGLLTLNALTASDEIIIPLQSEYLATKVFANLDDFINITTKKFNPNLIIGGVFFYSI